jgi:hypothetical protein
VAVSDSAIGAAASRRRPAARQRRSEQRSRKKRPHIVLCGVDDSEVLRIEQKLHDELVWVARAAA